MKIACGIDIIEINRIEKAITGNAGNKFLDTVYTKNEIQYCESHFNNKFQHYAARFAAKEAVFKAMSKVTNLKTVNWKNIEIINNANGKPDILINGKREQGMDISISHCKDYAVANVVFLFND